MGKICYQVYQVYINFKFMSQIQQKKEFNDILYDIYYCETFLQIHFYCSKFYLVYFTMEELLASLTLLN